MLNPSRRIPIRGEHGIGGESLTPKKIDEHCCNDQPGDRDLRIAPSCWPGLGKGRAIGRQLSIVIDGKDDQASARTRELCTVGCSGGLH